MDNKNIIIILLVIVAIILACILGTAFLPSMNAKKDSKIAIAGDKNLYVGDDLTVKLTDLNKTPIKKGIVNVTVTDKKGKVVLNKSLKTDSKGKAKVDLELDAGKYTVNATFAGDENFTGNATSKNITIKEIPVEEPIVSEESSASYDEGESGGNEIVESRDFVSWDYYPGHRIIENTYADGSVERYYDDGAYTYHDKAEKTEYYVNPDGSSGSMYVG